jgi:hypothetical protein
MIDEYVVTPCGLGVKHRWFTALYCFIFQCSWICCDTVWSGEYQTHGGTLCFHLEWSSISYKILYSSIWVSTIQSNILLHFSGLWMNTNVLVWYRGNHRFGTTYCSLFLQWLLSCSPLVFGSWRAQQRHAWCPAIYIWFTRNTIATCVRESAAQSVRRLLALQTSKIPSTPQHIQYKLLIFHEYETLISRRNLGQGFPVT